MKLFKTTNIISLFSGLVELSDIQAKARRRCVELVEDGIYRVVSEVQFKAGEVIGLEKMPRVFESALEDLSEAEEEAEEEAGIEVIAMAIFDLDEDNPDHYTNKGTPRVEAIEEIVGFAITAEQRDEAFKAFKAE